MIAYGLIAYAVAMSSLVYGIGFIGNLWVPKSIDTGQAGGFTEALIINSLLLGIFAVQHSVMARPAFKAAWTRIIPEPVERSTYVLLSGLILWLLYWQWQPMTDVIWSVGNETVAAILVGVYLLGWAIVVLSTFLISHTNLFGLEQILNHWRGQATPTAKFKTPFLYKFVRHPIYFGFLIVLWVTPVMTVGHLLFAALSTGYIVIGAMLEERDLVTYFGDAYRQYQKRVSMLVPWPTGQKD